jgi:hypothetical protein
MPTTTSKVLFRGAATTSTGTTLYTVPASTTAVVTNIVITNTSGTAGTFTLALDTVAIATAVPIAANDSTVIDMKQVLATTKTITGGASATSINIHISGVEIV